MTTTDILSFPFPDGWRPRPYESVIVPVRVNGGRRGALAVIEWISVPNNAGD